MSVEEINTQIDTFIKVGEQLKSAIQELSDQNENLVKLSVKLCTFLNPEWTNNTKLYEIIKSGNMPAMLHYDSNDFRINGQLTKPNSFINWLKKVQTP